MDFKDENMSLMNKRLDSSSPYWLKKFTSLLKRTENVEKQNLRLLNRLYQMKRIAKRLSKEKRFLMKRLDSHGDGYKKIDFFQSNALCDALHEPVNYVQPKPVLPIKLKPSTSSSVVKNKPKNNKRTQKKVKRRNTNSNAKQKPTGPKKPLNAFLWFCQRQRDVILSQNVGMTHQELTKHLSVIWNTLDEKNKEVYYEMFDKDKLRYESEMRALREKKEDENKPPPIASNNAEKEKEDNIVKNETNIVEKEEDCETSEAIGALLHESDDEVKN